MAGRRRVTGKFYAILAVVAAIIAFAVYMTRDDPVREVLIEAGTIGQTRELDAVVMRNETVVNTESYARVDYVAEECSLVSAGDTVASIYASGYSEKEMESLENTRKDIREYYNQILENILDSNLEQYTQLVAQRASELQTIIQGKEQGNLLTVQAQLEQAMTERQDYLRTTRASVGTQYAGLRVPLGAVYTVNGVHGVYKHNGDTYDFIPVNVTASDGEYALIEPVTEGAIYSGMAVVIK